MISRSTLVGALVVAELAIVGLGARAVAGGTITVSSTGLGPPPFPFGHGGSGFGVNAAARSTTPFERSFAAGPAPRVAIDVHDLNVYVQSGSVPAVRVVETVQRSGYVSGHIAELTAQQTLDGVRIATSGTTDVRVLGCFKRELHVTVPAGAHVEVGSAARVEATGLHAKLVAHIAEGAIHVNDQRGDVDVSTGSGWIQMVDVQASDIAATTRDGRVYLTRVGADRIDASSSSGRIVGVDVRAVDGALTTRDGRVILSFTGDSDATVSAHTADGHVRVSGLTTTQSDDQRSVVRLGSGRGRFDVSTENGPITITQGANV